MDKDLLPRLAGKTLIVKDADALLASPPDETLKALREAYDANAKVNHKPLKIGRIMILKRGMKLTVKDLNGKTVDVVYNGCLAGSFIKVLFPAPDKAQAEERTVSVHDVRLPVPGWAEHWTVDEAAECISGLGGLSAKLWTLLEDVPQAKRTPLGGDGTDGTVETPDGRLGAFGDKLAANWDRLDFLDQCLLVDRYAAEYGDED